MSKLGVFFLVSLSLMWPAQRPCSQEAGKKPFQISPEFDWIGLGAKLEYTGLRLSPGLGTALSLGAGGVYEKYGFFHEPDGSLYGGNPAGGDVQRDPYYSGFVAHSSLGISQGLIWNERARENALECFMAYKLRFEKNFPKAGTRQLLFDSAFPDRYGILQHSFLLGLGWKGVDRANPHGVLSGTAAELSAEWAPGFLGNDIYGRADFIRLNLNARAFLPLFDLEPLSTMNAASAYAGVYAAVDYATGAFVPMHVFRSFGGQEPRKGLGFALRGLEDGRFDAPLKAVLNTELRMNLPALIDPSILPGMLFFLDCGYYDFIDRRESGFLFSAGAGPYLSLFGMANLSLTTQFALNEKRIDGNSWTPIAFEFIFHF
jgi:hypothetical protein